MKRMFTGGRTGIAACALALAVLIAGASLSGAQRRGGEAAQRPRPAAPADTSFKVVTWNMRGGSGIQGWVGAAGFDSNTNNCTDQKRPLNAWGAGVVQRYVTQHVASDQAVVAFATQEGWGCAQSSRVAPLLTGWKKWTHGRSGVNLFVRHGIVGDWKEAQIEKKGVGGMTEDRWVVGGEVCLSADCRRTAHMWSTHLAPAKDADWPAHVQKVLDYLKTQPQPQILMGDLNLWTWDQWSPRVTCGTATRPMAAAYAAILRAGFRDAWTATQRGPGWTGMTSRKAPSGNTYCGQNSDGTPFKRIDYVLTKGIEPVATELFGFTGPGKPHPSDHLGLKATLRVQPAGK